MITFREESERRIEAMSKDAQLQADAHSLRLSSIAAMYSYNFFWLGRPIIQYPQDICALQEIIWRIRPDLIVETGIAHGGSLILSASMLALLDYCDAMESGVPLDPNACKRRVLGIDIDIRPHNRSAIEGHPMAHRIDLIEGSSISPGVIEAVRKAAARHERVMVVLDSNHTHDHVLAELEAYAPLVTRGSYCVVFDTIVEDLPGSLIRDRPWSKGNNPKTAVAEFIRLIESEGRTAADGKPLQLAIDARLEQKLLLTVAPNGYLQRT